MRLTNDTTATSTVCFMHVCARIDNQLNVGSREWRFTSAVLPDTIDVFIMQTEQAKELVAVGHPLARLIKQHGFLCYREETETRIAENTARGFLALAVFQLLQGEHSTAMFNLRHAIRYACIGVIEGMTGYSPCTHDAQQLMECSRLLCPAVNHILEGEELIEKIDRFEKLPIKAINGEVLALYEQVSLMVEAAQHGA